MSNNVIYCAVDVDENSYNIAVFDIKDSSVTSFRSNPNANALISKIKDNGYNIKKLQLCYESTYLGFSLYRNLREMGIHCDVIATSSIPKPPGQRVKTDRIDARKLSEYYAKNMLTVVHAPTKDEEIDRDFLRSRKLISKQIKMTKTHMTSLCRRMDLDYRKAIGKPRANYWTQPHYKWLEKQINALPDISLLKINLLNLLSACNNLELFLQNYEQQIDHVSQSENYASKVKVLNCFRGLDTLSSMTLITELGDIRRFSHPSKTVGYAGLSIIESSSSGKEKKFAITKNGNKYIRTAVVEASQYATQPPRVSRALQARRQGVDPQFIDIADKCMHRLYKKSIRLLYKGKHKNKIKVACARELICFVWEALSQVN